MENLTISIKQANSSLRYAKVDTAKSLSDEEINEIWPTPRVGKGPAFVPGDTWDQIGATIRDLQAERDDPIYECDVCEGEFSNNEGVICQKCNTHDERTMQWGIVMERAEKAEAENFKLAAGQCLVDGGLVGDDGGTPYCTLKAENKRLKEMLKALRTGIVDAIYAHDRRCYLCPRS